MALYITPFGQMLRRRTMDEMVDRFFTPAENHVVTPLNVKVDDNGYTLTAFLPGFKAEDLSIEVKQNTVWIEGVLQDGAAEDDRYLLRERPVGKFSRAIRLPEEVDSNKVEAELKDGILTLHIPKAEEARPRKIKINLN
jgi:HSP20 family protein